VYVHQHIDKIVVSPVTGQTPPAGPCFSRGQSFNYQASALSGGLDITGTVGPFTWQSVNTDVTTLAIATDSAPVTGLVTGQVKVTAHTPGITSLVASNGNVNSQPLDFTTCAVQSITLAVTGSTTNSINVTSGSGKTVIAAGLLWHLSGRGTRVVAAKAGPDYIDPTFHAAASGRPCVNLDLWAMQPSTVAGLVTGLEADADLVLCEGVMGLFDGVPGTPGRSGAASDLAARLRLPVLLVYGDRDVFVPADHAVALYRQLPDARLLIAPNCPHQVMVYQPALFNQAAANFYRATENVARKRAEHGATVAAGAAASSSKGRRLLPPPRKSRPLPIMTSHPQAGFGSLRRVRPCVAQPFLPSSSAFPRSAPVPHGCDRHVADCNSA
jgi:hypothetical protein